MHTPREELASAITHGLGLLLAIAGTVFACVAAGKTGSPTRIVTVSLFGATMILVYLASTGFHLTRHPRRRLRWRLFDHAAIYALIAGTYTPVLLVAIGGAWGWGLLVAVWLLAVAGIVMKTLLVGRFDKLERIDVLLYLAMGWIGLVAIGPIWQSMTGSALFWMMAGGVAYTTGCIFFVWESLPFNHAIWHLFVLAGSACHYVMIVGHVLPIR